MSDDSYVSPMSEQWVVVCGLPGVGKTSAATTITDRLDARLIRTDVVRRDVTPDPDYTSLESHLVYGAALDRARREVDSGGAVVIDGTFRTAALREQVATLATDVGAEFRLVKVECPEDVVADRIAKRTDSESDADFAIHQQLRKEFEPIERDHLVIDNSGSKEAMREQITDHF